MLEGSASLRTERALFEDLQTFQRGTEAYALSLARFPIRKSYDRTLYSFRYIVNAPTCSAGSTYVLFTIYIVYSMQFTVVPVNGS